MFAKFRIHDQLQLPIRVDQKAKMPFWKLVQKVIEVLSLKVLLKLKVQILNLTAVFGASNCVQYLEDMRISQLSLSPILSS